MLDFFESAPLARKQWMTALATGVVAAGTVLIIQWVGAPRSSDRDLQPSPASGWISALAAGVLSGGTAFALNGIANRHTRLAVQHLRSHFESAAQGNIETRATVSSRDELGKLAASFNQLLSGFTRSTQVLQQRVSEQEKQKEDLQRQVIRLLDDVEGAARGDLTVQAEVTADVLGAVADSFNLTIQNLREIVLQVKQAARQVNKGSSESETFARGLSSDALRQAEELAVTLNSVRMMTDSIQRVSDSARQAEAVAKSASETALRGGEAVERTVAGILDIRETVAETTRKVKRLAESSQEISKIVAVISQIAS
jgi:twitching motility protein PilJ